ncbi:GIY-YIG nuclease family protein [Fodinibius sp. Rm-B-1B1-1]|uniref:GIY-YIG nuclease family protein n=1 Tax=Fodinibius alkaliphilus TaxID=3140241 RepID=UPI0038B3953E
MPYYVYITINPGRTTLYIGITNDLAERLKDHEKNRGEGETAKHLPDATIAIS